MPKDMRDARYDILFEPVRIGPKVAKNRFHQVPHCNGGGYRDPSAVAEIWRTKAEDGWGVIFTEQTEIHPRSEITPFIERHLWDDRDIPALVRMAEAMKCHGALAGIQLAYSGINGPNLYSREVPLAVTGGPILTFTADPEQARTMDREDIRECIGCNICVSRDMTGDISPRTQNTAFMEEWRKGWHPERVRPKGASESVLVVGAGPAGIEARCSSGGKSPNPVFADCRDLDADMAAFGIVFNQGEVCSANARLCVQRGIRDAFLEKLSVSARRPPSLATRSTPPPAWGPSWTSGRRRGSWASSKGAARPPAS